MSFFDLLTGATPSRAPPKKTAPTSPAASQARDARTAVERDIDRICEARDQAMKKAAAKTRDAEASEARAREAHAARNTVAAHNALKNADLHRESARRLQNVADDLSRQLNIISKAEESAQFVEINRLTHSIVSSYGQNIRFDELGSVRDEINEASSALDELDRQLESPVGLSIGAESQTASERAADLDARLDALASQNVERELSSIDVPRSPLASSSATLPPRSGAATIQQQKAQLAKRLASTSRAEKF